jgi:hypothetical protein
MKKEICQFQSFAKIHSPKRIYKIKENQQIKSNKTNQLCKETA